MSNVGCQDSSQIACPEGETAVIWNYVRDSDGAVMTATAGCPSDPPTEAQQPQVNIPAEALKAFKKTPLPDSKIAVQPPGGETLVNFKTIVYTEAGRYQVPVHLDRVDINLILEVWPTSFEWKYGDGTTQVTTTTPGQAWFENADVDAPEFITHTYTKLLEKALVSVSTTWAAQFKVVGEPDWRPVDGTVTKAGIPVELTVLEATPELVSAPN